MYISVVTLIMQGLCDAISKRGKVQINHWGRLPLPPLASMHACCRTSEPKMKAGIHAVEVSPHLNRVDTLTLSHVQPFAKRQQRRKRREEEMIVGKKRKSSVAC